MKDSVKSKKASTLSQFMDKTFEDLKQTDPEFGEALQKWKRLLFVTILKIANVTNSSMWDVYHELMIPLVKINSVHKLQLYRYKKKVYELDKIDGHYVRLIPLKYNIRKSCVVWTALTKIEPIKQASISSLIYKKIQQQASVMVRSAFTKKKGFEIVSQEEGYVKMRNGDYGERFKPIMKNNVVKTCIELSLDTSFLPEGNPLVNSIVDSNSYEAEEECSVKEVIEKLLEKISWPARDLLKLNLTKPGMGDNDILKTLNFTRKRLDAARSELIRNYDELIGNQYKSPYAPNAIYNGLPYYIVDQDDEYIIIKAGKQNRSVHKSRVKIETELAYRTPIHLPASLVS